MCGISHKKLHKCYTKSFSGLKRVQIRATSFEAQGFPYKKGLVKSLLSSIVGSPTSLNNL